MVIEIHVTANGAAKFVVGMEALVVIHMPTALGEIIQPLRPHVKLMAPKFGFPSDVSLMGLASDRCWPERF